MKLPQNELMALKKRITFMQQLVRDTVFLLLGEHQGEFYV